MIFHHFNELHLGDHLVHLNFLRRLAKKYQEHGFVYYANISYINQIVELVMDLDNLKVAPMIQAPPTALNVWRGVDGFFYRHPLRFEFAEFHLEWFSALALKMGLVSPIETKHDLIFDYPAINNPRIRAAKYDLLFINSEPLSNQVANYNEADINSLLLALKHAGVSVWTTKKTDLFPCTLDYNLSVTGVGTLSNNARIICGIPTGPVWPTFNIWNLPTIERRIFLLKEETLDFPGNTVTVRSMEGLWRELALLGCLGQ